MSVIKWLLDRGDQGVKSYGSLLTVNTQVDPVPMAIEELLDAVVYFRMHLEKQVPSPSRWAIVFLVIDDINQLKKTGTLNGDHVSNLQDGSITYYMALLIMLLEISGETKGGSASCSITS